MDLPVVLFLVLVFPRCYAQVNLRPDLMEKEKRLPKNCGITSPSTRIVGGTETKVGEYPWMALLGFTLNSNGSFIGWLCGGSLISDRHILTAAHCVNPEETVQVTEKKQVITLSLTKVRLGEHNLSSKDGTIRMDYFPERIIVHEKRKLETMQNDIAIIKLSQTVWFTDRIMPICLPSLELRKKSLVGEWPVVAGWGKSSFKELFRPTHLMKVQLKVLITEECYRNWTQMKVPYANFSVLVMDKTVLCAAAKDKDSCKGDSGGPLMYYYTPEGELKPKLYQVGIVSYGYDCAYNGIPGVYARVSEFMNWILDHLDI